MPQEAGAQELQAELRSSDRLSVKSSESRVRTEACLSAFGLENCEGVWGDTRTSAHIMCDKQEHLQQRVLGKKSAGVYRLAFAFGRRFWVV